MSDTTDWETLEVELGERVVNGMLDEWMFGPEVNTKLLWPESFR